MKTQQLVRAALIAAVYVALTAVVAPIAFGPLQFRPAEALALLPILFPEAIGGLYVGCLLANLLSTAGPWDVWLGSLLTLLAAFLTFATRRSKVAYLWPIAVNGLGVSAYLSPLLKLPFWPTALSIAASEALVVGVLGLPLLAALRRVDWRR